MRYFWLLLVLSCPLVASFPFEIAADRVKSVNKGAQLHASGNVIITYKQYVLSSDRFQYLKANDQIKLMGNVSIFDQLKNRVYSDEAVLFLALGEGHLTNASIQTSKDYIIQSSRVLLKSDAIELMDCTITTCQAVNPEWYFKTQLLLVNKRNNFIHANRSVLYFYGLPVFYMPSFSQSVADATVSNRPIPDFGYNVIDHAYLNVYTGYLVSENISGKVGLGISQQRGIRYGASHIYAPQKNQSVELKTFNVQQTGFEGGLSYRWRNEKNDDFQPLISTLFVPTENSKTTMLFSVEYLFNNAYFNELYHGIPVVRWDVKQIPFYYGFELNSGISTGYFVDRFSQGNRHQLWATLNREIVSHEQMGSLANTVQLLNNNYSDGHWRRLLNRLIMTLNVLNTKNQFAYTKVLINSGQSPFIFDAINEINDDEISAISTITLLPLTLAIHSDYQLNSHSFRNFQYSVHWAFQCWQLGVNVNPIWKDISFGISIPNI